MKSEIDINKAVVKKYDYDQQWKNKKWWTVLDSNQ